MDENKDADYYDCCCNSIDHILRMTYFKTPEYKDWEEHLYVEVHLAKLPFFQRVKIAIKYIFGFQSRYGAFDEFSWDVQTTERFIALCQRFVAQEKARWETGTNLKKQ